MTTSDIVRCLRAWIHFQAFFCSNKRRLYMALLTAINRDAQEQIMSGLINVHLRHSERSKQSFNDKLNKLAERQDLDVVITSFHLSRSYTRTKVISSMQVKGSKSQYLTSRTRATRLAPNL